MEKQKGVFVAKKKSGEIYYRASFNYKGKHISLGSYEDCLTANKAYLEALKLANTPELSIEDYSDKVVLNFENGFLLLILEIMVSILKIQYT